MKIQIGTRVRYNEEHGSPDDVAGSVVEPTGEELAVEAAVGQTHNADHVRVAWDDGERFWEDPASLVVLEDA